MSSCCNPRGYDKTFNTRFARRMANRYRKRGLDKTAKRMVELIADVPAATVLEVGGGVGEIQVELLKRGAVRATNLELSEAYEPQARQLLADSGLSDRVQRRIVDISEAPGAVEPADVVVLHRVVCCYPDYARLLGAAADHARRRLVFSHPPRNPASRAFFAAQNLVFRVQGSKFRVFTHPPRAMHEVLAQRGFRVETVRSTIAWRVVAAEADQRPRSAA
jgi:2-polyprenyl-3-methyl-5-hydroxy-6-metoxy-1,4-benzoquinol methylase